MKKSIIFIILAVFFANEFAFSQTKNLTIDEAVVGVYRELYPEYIRGLNIRPASKEFSKIVEKELILTSFDLKNESALINLDNLNSALSKIEKDSLKSLPQYKWLSKNTLRFFVKNNIFDYDVSKKQITFYFALSDDFENIDFCEENKKAAFTQDNNLSIIDSEGNIFKVSNEENKDIVFGQTVHRNEFGIEKGTFWSPKGNFLAFYRNDQTMVTDYPRVNTNARIAEATPFKYCMAGMKSEEVTLGIYNVKTQKINYIETGKPKEQFLTNIAWSPDEKHIYIAVLNRGQNHMKLNKYDIETGKFVKTLFEEKHEKYVEPLHPMVFLPKDPSKFIWQTRKDGFSHLYLYNDNGQEISQITKGNFEVQQVYGFTPNGKDILINANKETPIDFDIYRVNIASGAMIRISQNPGSHRAIIAEDYSYLIDNYSSTTAPNEYVIYDLKGKKINTILSSKNPLEDYNIGEMKISTLKANDGKTDLYYRIILPPDFDASKKYPAIIYVYGGPHAQLVENRWLGGAAGWDYYMAQEGYIMFTLDNRGSANRGLEFENIIFRQLGSVETQDQITGYEYLKSLGYVDTERIGVHGWSYGGFMTTTLMTEHADIFKVGVAGGPVINWELYEIMYGERYMDTPEENPEGYAQSNLLNKVDKLTGRLMLIHGAVDPVVVWQHSLNFLNKCIEQKVLVDYFVYPSHEHNVRGYDRIHLMRTVTRYFKDNL
ncbi:MAG TPA: DPP IV N-terminal domain-containing protein [Bacteroidales bacterium]|nr:DPP IV N-terminal domain-containing protein [Bacteroidales bacterium]HOR60828.1 DPP IV N-terminal domain-containing protein [Bacteroidales bacterium]HPL05029.1 DPP IV N-terminal domain-containing protein [Bacteroidales bacterium]